MLIKIHYRIQCCLKKNARIFNLMVVFQSNKLLSTLFICKLKLVRFKCNFQNGICYGKTIRHSTVTACNNLGITPSTGKKVKSPNESAIFDHILCTVHKPRFGDFEPIVRLSRIETLL